MDLKSVEEFQKNHNSGLVVLNFWADWAEPCKQMNEVFVELSKKFTSAKFYLVEAESLPDLLEQYEVVVVPTFVILKQGKLVEKVEGAQAAELTKKVTQHAQNLPNVPTQPAKDINTRLKELTNAAECVAFIKGTPSQPKCGFTRQLIEIFEKNSVEYDYFNILADDEVRQELKTYSNWPTYPQVYVKGQLIGGLDIIKELVESGELLSTVPVINKEKKDLNTRLKELINKAPVMLFMKGNPSQPQCGFSSKIVKLLDSNKITYDSFNILSDEEVRQGLKTYSNWPTYPQLYVKGELIGGLDIVQEMADSGELESIAK